MFLRESYINIDMFLESAAINSICDRLHIIARILHERLHYQPVSLLSNSIHFIYRNQNRIFIKKRYISCHISQNDINDILLLDKMNILMNLIRKYYTKLLLKYNYEIAYKIIFND